MPLTKPKHIPIGNLSGQMAHTNMPTDGVIQVVHSIYDTQETYSVASGSHGGYSNIKASITPKFSDSKIFGIINLDGITWTSDNTYGWFKLYKDNGGGKTEIQKFGYPRQWNSVDNSSGTTMTCHFYDTPGSTVSWEYSFRFYSASGTSAFNLNRDGNPYCDSNVTLMEIRQ